MYTGGTITGEKCSSFSYPVGSLASIPVRQKQQEAEEEGWSAGSEEDKDMGQAYRGEVSSLPNPASYTLAGEITGKSCQIGFFILKCLHKDLQI